MYTNRCQIVRGNKFDHERDFRLDSKHWPTKYYSSIVGGTSYGSEIKYLDLDGIKANVVKIDLDFLIGQKTECLEIDDVECKYFCVYGKYKHDTFKFISIKNIKCEYFNISNLCSSKNCEVNFQNITCDKFICREAFAQTTKIKIQASNINFNTIDYSLMFEGADDLKINRKSLNSLGINTERFAYSTIST